MPASSWRICNTDVCPYRHYSWLIPLVTFLGTVFFLIPAFGCSLMRIRMSLSTDEDGKTFELDMGYWNIEQLLSTERGTSAGSCERWTRDVRDEMFDATWKFGRALGGIGGLSCLLTAMFNLLLVYMRFQIDWFVWMVVVHVFNALLCFLLLVGLASDVCDLNNCKLGSSGYLAIVGGVLWLLASLLYWMVRRQEVEMIQNEAAQSEMKHQDPTSSLYDEDKLSPLRQSPKTLPPPPKNLRLNLTPRRLAKSQVREDNESPKSPSSQRRQKTNIQTSVPPIPDLDAQDEPDMPESHEGEPRRNSKPRPSHHRTQSSNDSPRQKKRKGSKQAEDDKESDPQKRHHVSKEKSETRKKTTTESPKKDPSSPSTTKKKSKPKKHVSQKGTERDDAEPIKEKTVARAKKKNPPKKKAPPK